MVIGICRCDGAGGWAQGGFDGEMGQKEGPLLACRGAGRELLTGTDGGGILRLPCRRFLVGDI